MAFLDRSLEQRDREDADRERERRAKLRRARVVAGVLATFLAVAVSLAYFAWRENARAEINLALAREAVDESLSSADRDPARVGADVPQVEEFRRELLAKAERFYTAFMNQEPRSEASGRDLAFAHFRLGHINRMLERRDEAAREYQDSIARFDALRAAYPANLEYRAALANAYNWLGETGLCSSGMPLACASRRRSGAVSPVISRAGRVFSSSARTAAMASAPVRCSRRR